MEQDDRLAVLFVWNALIVFCCVLFFTGSLFKSALVAAFVWVSCALGYGQRWLLRAGLALAVMAIAVSMGVLPPLEQWGSVFRDAWSSLAYRSR